MVRRCLVTNCRSGTPKDPAETSYESEPVVFLNIPKDKTMKKLWLRSLRLNGFPKNCTTICHKHFNFDDFLPASQNLNTKGQPLKRPALKKAAIPTIVWSLETKATTAKGISEEILRNATVPERPTHMSNIRYLTTVPKKVKKAKKARKGHDYSIEEPQVLDPSKFEVKSETVKSTSRFCAPEPSSTPVIWCHPSDYLNDLPKTNQEKEKNVNRKKYKLPSETRFLEEKVPRTSQKPTKVISVHPSDYLDDQPRNKKVISVHPSDYLDDELSAKKIISVSPSDYFDDNKKVTWPSADSDDSDFNPEYLTGDISDSNYVIEELDAEYVEVENEEHEDQTFKDRIALLQTKLIGKKDRLGKIEPGGKYEGKRKSKLPCPICNKAFKKKIAVKRHIEGVHEGKKRVNCDLCDQNFASKQALNYHTAAIHEGKKFAICSEEDKVVCDICKKQCNGQKKLNEHTASQHKGEKNYPCTICEAYFNAEHLLSNHLQKNHSQETKKYLCEACNERFADSKRLKSHYKSKKHDRRAKLNEDKNNQSQDIIENNTELHKPEISQDHINVKKVEEAGETVVMETENHKEDYSSVEDFVLKESIEI